MKKIVLLLLLLMPLTMLGQTKEESYNLGVEAFGDKEYQKAITHFTRVIKADYQEFVAVSYNYRGLCKKYLRNFKGAKSDFKKALEIEHESLYVHNNLANIYYVEGNYEMAIEHFSIALSFEPSNSTICTNLANSYFQLSSYNAARKYYQKALESNPYNENAEFGLAEVDRMQSTYGQPAVMKNEDMEN